MRSFLTALNGTGHCSKLKSINVEACNRASINKTTQGTCFARWDSNT